jgi:GAF domain-containing protein
MPITNSVRKVLVNIERIKILRDLSLIDSPTETIYDRFTQLASDIIGAPVSLVSMVAADYQFFKSQVGLPEPWSTSRRTPLSHSFCQHVVATQEPLIVTDARENDLVKDNLAILDLNVIGYLGMPLTMSDGSSLGSFCVIDSAPRKWQDIEIEIMRHLSEIVCAEIDARAHARINRHNPAELAEFHKNLDEIITQLKPIKDKERFLERVKELREMHNI